MNMAKKSAKFVIGSAFDDTIVLSHSILSKVVLFRQDRKERLENIAQAIPTKDQIRAAQNEAEWLIVKEPIVSSSRYPRRSQ
jgi:hypothetical protein